MERRQERRQEIHGSLYSFPGPATYADVMREAEDNDAVTEPTQFAAEHTVHLPDFLYDRISEARYDGDDETERLRSARWGFDSEPWEEPQQ